VVSHSFELWESVGEMRVGKLRGDLDLGRRGRSTLTAALQNSVTFKVVKKKYNGQKSPQVSRQSRPGKLNTFGDFENRDILGFPWNEIALDVEK